jgi:hypothetical protein
MPNNKKICAQEVLEILREPKITFKVADKEFNDLNHSVDIFIQKYAFFIKEINKDNYILSVKDFNQYEDGQFYGIYEYSKE